MTDPANNTFEISDAGYLIRLEPLRLEFTNADNDWDRSWIKTKVEVIAGPFSGEYIANVMTTDFETFKQQIKAVYRSLTGVARFEPLENQLIIEVQADDLGHIQVKCEAAPQTYNQDRLSFSFALDQTYLPNLVNQLQAITEIFPVSGNA